MSRQLTTIPLADADDSQIESIFAIWNAEYPVEVTYKDLAALRTAIAKFAADAKLYICSREGAIVGFLIAGTREDSTDIIMAIRRSEQGSGLGTELLSLAKQDFGALYGWVVGPGVQLKTKDGQDYRSPLLFYEKNDFTLAGPSQTVGPLRVLPIAWASGGQN